MVAVFVRFQFLSGPGVFQSLKRFLVRDFHFEGDAMLGQDLVVKDIDGGGMGEAEIFEDIADLVFEFFICPDSKC